MKNKCTIFLGILFLLLSFKGFSFKQEDVKSFDDEIDAILMRKIGHQILLYLGDSTSTLLPIKEISKFEFQIVFESPFKFQSDSIVKIINENIGLYKSNSKFIVKVLDCLDDQLIFGYAMFNSTSNDLVACLGRDQAENCYKINILFSDSKSEYIRRQYINAGSSLFIVMLLSLALYKFYKNNELSDQLNPNDDSDIDEIHIGEYVFNYNQQSLVHNGSIIELTSKECRLLHIFASNPNQVIERDELQKEVWENDGVIVGRSLDMFISKLRKKLDSDSNVKIINIHGKGYKLMIKN